MLILLPPSEGKTAPAAGEPVDAGELYLPELGAARRKVLGKLVTMCRRTSARSVAESLKVLGLSEGQRDEVARNAGLNEAAAGEAAGVYTGVLYEALDVAALAPAAGEWVRERAVVFSGLWGVVRLGDRIPAYRCSIGATLPAPVGGLTAYWKKALKTPMDRAAEGTPVLDLRSGAYAATWTPGGNAASVRVLHERVVRGERTRSVVSHFNKATKGRIVRALAENRAEARDVDELITALRDLKFTIEEEPAAAADRPRRLDIVVTEI